MQESVISSGVQSAASQVFTGRGKIHYLIVTPAAATATITAYDGVAAVGTAIAVITAQSNGGSTAVEFTSPIECQRGLYITVSGVGAQFFSTFSRC